MHANLNPTLHYTLHPTPYTLHPTPDTLQESEASTSVRIGELEESVCVLECVMSALESELALLRIREAIRYADARAIA